MLSFTIGGNRTAMQARTGASPRKRTRERHARTNCAGNTGNPPVGVQNIDRGNLGRCAIHHGSCVIIKYTKIANAASTNASAAGLTGSFSKRTFESGGGAEIPGYSGFHSELPPTGEVGSPGELASPSPPAESDCFDAGRSTARAVQSGTGPKDITEDAPR